MELIACVDKNWGIGKDNTIPWNEPDDRLFFKIYTSSDGPNGLLMGRKTYDSMPKSIFSQNRQAFIVSSSLIIDEAYVKSFTSLHEAVFSMRNLNRKFCIGGSELFKSCLDLDLIDSIYITHLDKSYDCDVSFPHHFLSNFKNTDLELINTTLNVKHYTKHNGEKNYLDLMKLILCKGKLRMDRTKVGIYSIFSHKLNFDLSHGFPLLTTKRVYWKGIVEELLWFLKGDTNVNHLIDKNVHIWDLNSTREYMDSIGIDREERDIGPCYGWQWRHFGAQYTTMHDSYDGKGFDQIAYIINEIKTNKTSRRIVMSAWNPPDLKYMNLPPCHVMYQFYVESNRYLSCQMYQRSADVFLGLPFNIGSTALLTHIIAKKCNLEVGKLHICIGDAHIYKNHVDQAFIQLQRTPYEFPNLTITKDIEDIELLDSSYFELTDYKSHGTIKAQMAV